MIASQAMKTQVLLETSVQRKMDQLGACLKEVLAKPDAHIIPSEPGRDVQIWSVRDLPAKAGLSSREGQARLLHDLASIELQAMELGLRTLIEFPEAPEKFRQELAEITAEEGEHLRLCVEALEGLGVPWGHFPTHLGLWQAVDKSDSLLDRILIVHRYLEGSGLDASSKILRRLTGVKASEVTRALTVIFHDELAHVRFGSCWYHALVREEGRLDPVDDFRARLERLAQRVPRRLEPIQADLRASAGFLSGEIEALREFRDRHFS